MIDVENGEHQSSNTFLAHLYLSSNIPVKRLNTNLQTTSLGTLSCVQELVSTTICFPLNTLGGFDDRFDNEGRLLDKGIFMVPFQGSECLIKLCLLFRRNRNADDF